MKLTQTIPAIVLGLAATVTAGSVYVTVQAAQQGSETIPAPALIDDSQQPLEVVGVGSERVVEDLLRSRSHYSVIDENGGLTGRLLTLTSSGVEAAAGLTVKLIKDGSVLATANTSSDGTFSVQGLPEGTVAVLAYGPDQFMLYAINLRRVDHFGAAPAIQEIGLSSAVTSGADAQLAKELVYGSYQEKEWRFQGAVGQSGQAFPEDDQLSPSTATVHQNVQLTPDGSLVGEVNLLDPRTGLHQEVRDLTIHFISNGSVIGSTDVDANGSFRMQGLQPGVHSLVSTGRDGVLALGINIVGANVAQKADGQYKLTSIAQTLDLAVAPVTYRNFSPDFVEDSNVPTDGGIVSMPPMAAPMGPGGFGPGGMGSGGIGSGGGAGGGIGGGGGLGALLGAAAGAGIGYAIADDDDSPASPAR